MDHLDSGSVPISNVMRLFKELGLPKMDDDILEFFEYLNFRNTSSVEKMNYQKFLEIFDDDYLIGSSPFEDSKEFSPSPDTSIEIDKNEIQQTEQSANVIDQEDLMITVDDVLTKIRLKFPEKVLQNFYFSIMDSIKEEMINYQKIRYILQADLISYLTQKLQIQLTDKELQCILHILSKEDLQGIILFDELKQLIKDFTKKE